LNYIHRALKYNTQRHVPAVNPEDDEAIEVYHREVYKGVSYDVCVIYPVREEGGFKECIAIVKFSEDDLSAEGCLNAVVCSDAAWTEAAQKDKFTSIVDKLDCNYWAPRWKYVVKSLCNRMAHDFDKYGIEIHQEVVADMARGTDVGAAAGTYDNGEVIEEVMQIFSGATGKIIGPKGAKIYEIKDATHVEDIKMPAKNEDGTRPRARELVDITIKGTQTQINAAKAMIQTVNDEWVSFSFP
jgi:hypothetical protein